MHGNEHKIGDHDTMLKPTLVWKKHAKTEFAGHDKDNSEQMANLIR